MSEMITRRDFLKITGLGTGAAAVLTGCGPASRYVMRRPYSDMPEYTQTGKSTFFATTCGECSAGCGLIARTMEGRALKVDGNPAHPVAHGATCSRGQATLQGLYNPDRIINPAKQNPRASGKLEAIQWEQAVGVVKDALQNTPAAQVAFLMGLFPDHLYDLVQLISAGLGGATVARYGALAEFEGRITFSQAAQKIYGQAKIPAFDLERAEIVLSFGANFVETWLSPVAEAFGYGMMRQGLTGQRGYLVQFEPRMSQTAANADEWYPIQPGSEGLVALGLGRLVAELKGVNSGAYANIDLADVSSKSGISEQDLRRLAALYANSPRPLAIPGGIPLGYSNGLESAEAILALNVLVENGGKEGGVFFLPDNPVYPDIPYLPDSAEKINALIEAMNQGQIKALFIHGINPVYDIPKAFGFTQALQKVPLVISFASFPDETAQQADYLLPDHTPLESWGYQKVMVGSNRTTLSGLQPVVVPLHDTRSTTDILLAAVEQIGGNLAQAVPYTDEVDFLQNSVAVLMDQGGIYTAPTSQAFFSLWQQHGGWWKSTIDWLAAQARASIDQLIQPSEAQFNGDPVTFPLYLLPFPSPNLGDGSAANRPMLQEAPDPMTTVMWNSWLEINPDTAAKLGIKDDDVVKISTASGEVVAAVYEFPGIHPDVVAVPLGQGHTAFGRYAQQRGINAQDVLAGVFGPSGNLAFMATRVKITPTGQKQALSRYESREGVYGTRSFRTGG
jgi:anaerobic selenocysteine-containing dehydrogenase